MRLLLRLLVRQALRRGGPWTYAALAMSGLRLLASASRRRERVVYKEKLKPGQTLTVAHRRERHGGRRA
ncbi:MAG: hypothetical protein ACKVWR_12165 [Acidimicrobiales bacterium]